jgi:hypothetical protein
MMMIEKKRLKLNTNTQIFNNQYSILKVTFALIEHSYRAEIVLGDMTVRFASRPLEH